VDLKNLWYNVNTVLGEPIKIDEYLNNSFTDQLSRAALYFPFGSPMQLRMYFMGSETVIHHDLGNASIPVSKCALPGCSEHKVKYSAASAQIDALVELSRECSQDIKVSKILFSVPVQFKTCTFFLPK
jgi:hypothetical protein